MEKFRYYVIYWSRTLGPGGDERQWKPSARVVDRDASIETADDITDISHNLSAETGEVVCVTDWKRIQ